MFKHRDGSRGRSTYAIEARYPERKQKLFQQCTRDEAEKILGITKEMVTWLKELADKKLSQKK